MSDSITFDRFPKQGAYVGRRVRVCFDYDTSKQVTGTVVREDVEEPGEMIIKLDNGRYVRSVECQYGFLPKS
jgi:hypothetical protein